MESKDKTIAIPDHLNRYIVDQDQSHYSELDHSLWRLILRQLRRFLSHHAHSHYLEGLEKTGIDLERIPSISDISEHLQKYGWRAVPVSGFIPPAAFMEMQSLGLLPIASDMRTAEHLKYTPAPDIVHEAAGHAPFLIHPDFSSYLREYAQVAKRAIISHEDLDIYEAIRKLSDVKEHPQSTPEQVKSAEKHLTEVTKKATHVSEAALLSRMNWWTAEYGLIGDLENPKIFGAGLLSSVGESKWCLSGQVKKIPLSLDCINYSYDITEPQPQLFVARDFQHLKEVLHELAETMAFKKGGLESLEKAKKSSVVNTVVWNSGVQVSGHLTGIISREADPVYLQFQGPVQVCFKDKEIQGQGVEQHPQGFGAPVGELQSINDQNLRTNIWESSFDWSTLGFSVSPKRSSSGSLSFVSEDQEKKIKLRFESGLTVEGVLRGRIECDGLSLLLKLGSCKVIHQQQVLFDPSWGEYDLVLGSKVISVFGGSADRERFGECEDFINARVPSVPKDQEFIDRMRLYKEIRDLREDRVSLDASLHKNLIEKILKTEDGDWMLKLELLEILARDSRPEFASWKAQCVEKLHQVKQNQDIIAEEIQHFLNHV